MSFSTQIGRAGRKRRPAVGLALLGGVAAGQLIPTSLAFAEEATKTIDGTMVVKLQADAAKQAMVATGDALGLLVAGILVLALGVACLAYSSGRFAKGAVVSAGGAHVSPSVRMSPEKALIAAVAAALVASCFFGAFASRQASAAAEIAAQSSSTVVVDSNGKVISSSIAVENTGERAITVTKVAAPDSLQGWTATVEGATVAAGSNAKGAWSGAEVSKDVLKQLSANNGEIKLSYSVTLKCDSALNELDFSKFTVDTEDKTFQAAQIKPAVVAEGYTEGVDYTVTYGDNYNAGDNVGTVTIKGTGNYSGEKTYSFNIKKKDLDYSFFDSDAADQVYSGSEYKPAVTCSNADYAEGRDYEILYDGNIGVGDGYVCVKGIGNYGGYVFFDFKITPKPVDVAWAGYNIDYDGKAHVPTATVDSSGVCEGDTVEVSVKTADGKDAIEAGTYTAQATSENPNYVISDATKTHRFTIRQASVL